MSKFLKITNFIINKNFIHHIVLTNQDKIIIQLMANKMDGFFLFGGGRINSQNTTIELCKTKHSKDFKIVTDWINSELK